MRAANGEEQAERRPSWLCEKEAGPPVVSHWKPLGSKLAGEIKGLSQILHQSEKAGKLAGKDKEAKAKTEISENYFFYFLLVVNVKLITLWSANILWSAKH